ncbi:MAG: phosphatase PAP2 family protein [Pseudomonadota bacterium]
MNAYLLALQRRLAQNRDVLQAAPAVPRQLRTITLVLLWTAALTAGLLGYHAGFAPLNTLGAQLGAHSLQMLTYSGDTLFAVLLLLPAARRFPQIVWLGIVAAVIAALISHGLKPLIDSARPPAVLAADSFHLVGTAYRSRSFPSGHTVTAFVAAGVYAWFLRPVWLRALLLLLATAVGFSRVAVGVHWPVDVLAGAALGLGSVAFAGWLTLRWRAGLRFLPYHGIVLLLSLTAVAALFVRAPYDAATPLLHTTACAGLTIALRDFLVLPVLDALQLAPQPPLRAKGLLVQRRS